MAMTRGDPLGGIAAIGGDTLEVNLEIRGRLSADFRGG